MLIKFFSSKSTTRLLWFMSLICAVFFGSLFATTAPSGVNSFDWHIVHFLYFWISLFGIAQIGRPIEIESSDEERLRFDIGID